MSNGMTKREWAGVVGAITGILALVVSAGTTYFTVIRQKDDLRVAVREPPEFTLDYDNDQFELADEQRMTFINSGNRAAVVSEIELWIEQNGKPVPERDRCNEAGDGVSIGYIFEPSVVKPSEIAAVKVKLKKSVKLSNPPTSKIKFSGKNATEPQVMIVGCLRFVIITPDNVSEEIDLPAFEADFPRDEKKNGPGEMKMWKTTPRRLLHASGTIFD